MKVAELKRLVTVGKKVILTETSTRLCGFVLRNGPVSSSVCSSGSNGNGHPYLNKEREVTSVNTVGFGLTCHEDGRTSSLDWPKASQLSDAGTDDKGRYFKVILPHATLTYLVLDEH